MINFECCICGNDIYSNDAYIEYDSEAFCSVDCLKDYLLDNAYYEEKTPYTEEDCAYDEADRRRDDAE